MYRVEKIRTVEASPNSLPACEGVNTSDTRHYACTANQSQPLFDSAVDSKVRVYRMNKLEITAHVGHAKHTTVLSTVYTVGASSITA